MRLEPRSISDAIELGYRAGNLHWRVRFEGEVLFVAMEGRPQDYTARLREMISERRVGVTILDEEDGDGSADEQGLPTAADHHYHRDGHS
jgi:urease accessory protein